VIPHQYVDRRTGEIRDERIFADRLVSLLYGSARERAPALFRALTGPWASRLFGLWNYDLALGARITGNRRFLEEIGVDWSECLDPPETLTTARRVFERRIRYWESRPMPADPGVVVSPCDARVLLGSLHPGSPLVLKEKFFSFEELLGRDRRRWLDTFLGGDYAVFRLTPDKYHYNHVPAAGRVLDHYVLRGRHHSCNPGAVVALATPYSKNERVVTVLDTDVAGGSRVGRVAMIEIVALMVGEIVQAYSESEYARPRPIERGMLLRRGAPKSLFRPGSSTVVLLFERGRVRFDADLVRNLGNPLAQSRFCAGFRAPLVETDVEVRSSIGRAVREE
jgi:phosphatidylserine decarboxylase